VGPALLQCVFWHGHDVSYRGKVKNGSDHRKASDNVEHIFGDGFEHNPTPVVDD